MVEIEKIRRHCDNEKRDAARVAKNGHYSNSPAHWLRGEYDRNQRLLPDDLSLKSLYFSQDYQKTD